MAGRWWVGGTGNWDAVTTTHWSGTSGGAGGSSVPTSADTVTFDTLSNATAYTVTLTATANCASLTVGAPLSGNVTFAGASIALNVFGSFTLYAGMTWGAIWVYFVSTGVATITTAGKTISVQEWNGIGGSWTLQDDFLSDSGPTLRAGTLNTNGKAFTCVGFNSSNSTNPRTLTLGASVFTCNSWTIISSNLTFNANTSQIIVNGSSNFTSAGQTYNRVDFTGTAGGTITGANTFATLNRTNASGYASLLLGADQTVTGTFTVTGVNANVGRIYIASNTVGTPRTITAAVVALTNCDFEDIAGAGAATWSGTLVGDCGGNTNITGATPISCYWVHDGTASHPVTDARWFTASGGATPARVPLPQDTAVFDALSFPTTGKTVAIGLASYRMPNFIWTGATNAPTFNFDQAGSLFYGSIAWISGMTLTLNNSHWWRGRGNHTVTSAGKTVTLIGINAVTGTYTLLDAFISIVTTVQLTSGTFNANGFNVTTALFDSSVSAVRALTMGSGTWTLTGTGTVWNLATVTNLTLTPGTSTIVMNDASAAVKTFSGGGKTYYNLTLAGAGSGTFDIVGANTFNLIALGAQTIRFTAATTTTLANMTGASATITSITASNHTLTKTGAGVVTVTATTISRSTATAGKFFAEASSVNGGNNTGWIFGNPVDANGSAGQPSCNLQYLGQGMMMDTSMGLRG